MRGTISYTSELTAIECGVCYVPFAIPVDMLKQLRQRGDRFYCPHGHGISYHETENTRLRAQLDQANAHAKFLRGRVDDERREKEHNARRANGYKGQLVKTKKRVAKGVCPCCNRSFVNVAKHMAGQHPDYGGER